MLGLQETRSAGTPTTKTYSCVACSASFQSLASLLVHQASHANEISQPESTGPTCVSCGSLFASTDLLEKHHCTVAQTPAPQEMYVCECGVAFNALTAFEDHKKIHQPDAEVSLNLDRIPKPLSSEVQPDSKTDSSLPVSGQVSPSVSPCHSNEEPLVKCASSASESDNKEIVSTTDISLPVESNILSEQDQNVKPYESPSPHPMTEEQESILQKDSDTLESSSTSNLSVHDSEKSSDSCKDSNAFNRKSILKMLASAYMSHRRPTQMKPEQIKRNLPPRKVAPRAPMQTATAITMSKPEQLEDQSKTKDTEKVLCSSSTAVNVRTGKMLSKKGKIISVTQTVWPVVVLETRQKLLGKDNVEGRHKCGLCRKVFQDIDSLIMHHAQHKKERVKFCLCCQQFVICVPENHNCFGTFAENKRQCFPIVGNTSPTVNSPTTPQMEKLFHCSLCKRSYMRKRSLKRHNCPGRATLKCSASVGNGSGSKHGFKDESNREESTQHVNVGVGTELIKTEEQGTEFSVGGKHQPVFMIQSPSLRPGDQSHSRELFESINSTPTQSTETNKNNVFSANVVEVEAEDKDKFVEKQWTMPLDDAEIDVLIDVDQEDLDIEDNLAGMAKEDHGEDEDVVIVESSEDIKSQLPSNGLQVHMTDEGLKRFVCAGCHRSYSRRFTLMQHLKICGASKLKQQHRFVNTPLRVSGPDKKFPCPQCDKFFSRKDNMNMHRRKCHATNTNSLLGPRIVESKTQAARENLFVLSPSTETPTVRPESSQNSSSNWGIMSLPSVLPRRVTCECGASFTCPRLLFEHLQLHAQESYICPHCGENLQSWMDFEAHQQLHGQSQGQASEQRGLQLHPHSFSQVTQSHVPTQQQPHLFSQVVQSHVPVGPQQPPGFQASAVNFKGPPSALLPPQNLNHRPCPETLTCHRCKKTFARRRSLLRHLRLSCRGDATGLRKHSVHIQSNTFKPTFKPIRCPVCVRWFSCLDGLKRHLVSHSRQPVLSCQLCGHNCPSVQELEDHKRNVHEINCGIVSANDKQEQVCKPTGPQSTPTDFQCHICLRYYPKLQSLKDHVRKVHRPKETKPINLSTSDPIRSGQFQCQICMRTYPDIRSLKNHRRRVHHIVGGVFQPSKGTEQNRTSNQFHCQICGRSYLDIRSLQNHRRRVHRILGGLDLLKGISQQSQHNLYKCQICQRSYTDLVSLKNHRRRVHHIIGPVSETTMNDTVDALQQKQSDSQTYL